MQPSTTSSTDEVLAGEARVRLACLLALLHDYETRGEPATEIEEAVYLTRNQLHACNPWVQMTTKDLLRTISSSPNRVHLVALMVCTYKHL